jgi:hypothetical protein
LLGHDFWNHWFQIHESFMFSVRVKSTINFSRVEDVMRRRASVVLREAAEFWLKTYLSLAPEKTGAMKASASIEPVNDLRIRLSVNIYYAFWVEYGHMLHGVWYPPRPAHRQALAATAANWSSFGTTA